MEEINALNIPAYQRKRSLAAKDRALSQRKFNLNKKRKCKTPAKSRERSYDPFMEIPIQPSLSSVNQFPDPLEEMEKLSTITRGIKGIKEMKICGRCEGYFDKIDVAVIKVTSPIRQGDIIIFEKDQGLFEQKITSMQIDRKDVSLARSGSDIGLKVAMQPKVGTPVYKVI